MGSILGSPFFGKLPFSARTMISGILGTSAFTKDFAFVIFGAVHLSTKVADRCLLQKFDSRPSLGRVVLPWGAGADSITTIEDNS